MSLDNDEQVETVVLLSHKSPDSVINVKVEFGEGDDKISLDAIAEQIVQLHQKAYEVYLPLVEDVCNRTASEDELSHLLDYLLDFVCEEKKLGLYKKVCRKYLDVCPGCIKDYIEAYREMWGEEDIYGENC